MDKLSIAITIASMIGVVVLFADEFNIIVNGCTFILGICK